MTTRTRDQSSVLDAGAIHQSRSATRPRWLLPGVVGAVIMGGLVIAGVLSPEVVLYVGLFGGMVVMHAGGHGHGGHGGGHEAHETDGHVASANLSSDSPGVQPADAGSVPQSGSRAGDNSTENGTYEHDQHNSHGCCG